MAFVALLKMASWFFTEVSQLWFQIEEGLAAAERLIVNAYTRQISPKNYIASHVHFPKFANSESDHYQEREALRGLLAARIGL